MISGSKPPRNALPSASFGYWQATSLLLGIRFHIGAKQPWNSDSPKKNMDAYLKSVVGFSGSPVRPAYQDSHGTTVDRHGVPAFWQAAATGFVVSGVDVVRIRSAWPVISCCATCAALVGLDWLSWTLILIL